MRFLPAILLILIASPTVSSAQIRKLGLVLPTKNESIFGDPEKFYMYTNRSFEGESSKPWQAGQFGYVRNPKRTAEGLLYTRFHEGVDIRPVDRDPAGKPTDVVYAIADGKVVHLNPSAGASNYGRYAVVEHEWGYGPFYSLYAHLESITEGLEIGQKVAAGQPIAIMGYTGAGLDRTRAHLHLELCIRLSSRFGEWHDARYRQPNVHGNFNGINLAGIDIASLFAIHRKDPFVHLPAFIVGTEPYYRVRVPNHGQLELAETYPWLARPGRDPAAIAGKNRSWEIDFSASGLPLKITPSAEPASEPSVVWVKPSSTYHSYLTRKRLGGSGKNATLQASGAAYIQLLTGTF